MAAAGGARDLTSGPIARTLLLFALPTLGSSVLQALTGSINAIWVGRFLGETALASTSNANLVMFLLNAFVFGFGMAATVLIAQAFGRGDVDAARRAMGSAVGGFMPFAILIAVLGWLFAPQTLRVLGVPAEAFQFALDYLRMIFVAIPGTLVVVVLMMGLRGSGDSLTPLWFMVVAVTLDTILNPLLILGIGPFPELGITGSALATVISSYISLATLIAYIYWRDLPLRLRGAELRYLIPQAALVRTMIVKGVPMGLQMIVVSAASLATLGLVNQEGIETTAAFGVTMQLWGYIQMPAMALSAAASAMAAQNIGAGRWDRVDRIARAGVIANIAITGLLLIVLTAADHVVLGVFLGPDSPAVPIAEHIHLMASWSFLLFGITMILFGTVRANGAVIGPLIILAVGLFPIRLGFALAAYPWLGADALWLSFPAGSIANVVMAWLYYRRGAWRKGGVGGPAAPEEAAEQSLADCEPGGKVTPTL